MSMIRISSFARVGVFSLFVLLGCKTRNYNAGVSEAPTNADKPELLGLPATLSWPTLKDIKGGERSVPWTDTYWPLYRRGMAARWSLPEGGVADLSKTPDTPYQQVSQMLSVWEKNDKNQLSFLAPAEKYELLLLGANKPDAALMKLLKENEDVFQNSAELKSAKAKLDELLGQQKKFVQEYQNITGAINTLMSKLRTDNALLLNTRALVNDPRTRMRVNLQEANDRISALENSMRLAVEQIKIKTAALEVFEKDANEFMKKRKTAEETHLKFLKEYQKKSLPVASEMAKSMPMLSSSWQDFLRYSSSYDEDWSWMGHCHGWAPAALNEATPRHGVLARRAGKEIFLSEGDIRGLLTKVYANQAPRGKFASQRCNTDKLVKDRLGRVVDGKLCLGDDKKSCTQTDTGDLVFISTGQSRRGLTLLSRQLNDENPQVAVWVGGSGEDAIQVAVYKDLDAFSKNSEQIRAKDFSGAQKGILNINSACRDTNPMTLHLALKGLINDKKVGFVMDKTRTAQVWNQPVFKWQMTPVAIKKNDAQGTIVPGGEPVAIAEVDDLFKDYRAKGTAFLVQVAVKLFYGVENGPKLTYTAADEAVDVDTVFYTLELDKNQNLIGGEWGLIPTSKNAKVSALAEGRSGVAPDFLWIIDSQQKPTQGALSYPLIDKIHQCSLNTSGLQKYPWMNGPSLNYTVCNLDE